MNSNAQHCFLLDGKTIFPITDNHHVVVPLKVLHDNENKYYSCHRSHNCHCQYAIDKEVKAINNNKHCQIEEKDFCLCSFQSIEDRHLNNKNANRKILIGKRKNKNNIETCEFIRINSSFNLKIWIFADLITRILPSEDTHNSPSTVTIIIKPFISSPDEKLSLNKRKSSSSSLQTINKRISTSLLDQTVQIQQRQLSTFKDITRANPPSIILQKNKSLNILHPRTLLDIYLNKKQQ
jgi:hypothetical protein